jgi:hypothetical protein
MSILEYGHHSSSELLRRSTDMRTRIKHTRTTTAGARPMFASVCATALHGRWAPLIDGLRKSARTRRIAKIVLSIQARRHIARKYRQVV